MHLTLNGEAGFLPPPGLREFCGLGQRVFFAVFPVGPSEGLIYLTKVASEGFLTPRQGGAIPGTRESDGNVLHLPNSQNWQDVNPMDRADLYRVFELGGALRPLASLNDDTTLARTFQVVIQARNALSELLGTAPQAKVDLCVTAARELQAAVNYVEIEYFRDQEGKFAYPKDAATKTIDPWVLWSVTKAIQNFEAVFQAEMQTAATYWVPKRGSYSTRDLVDAFERSFLPEHHWIIGDVALHEYRNAGRCFAFGLWTAAGYHSCRAVEAVLRTYYSLITGKPDEEGKTWGDLINELKQHPGDPKPTEKVIFYLQQLKDNERNPLMHVRVVLDEQDADILLISAKIVIAMMAREIKAVTELRAAQQANLLTEHAAKQALLEAQKSDDKAA